eukprot:9498245-Pyramimonas_sp.AAC.1
MHASGSPSGSFLGRPPADPVGTRSLNASAIAFPTSARLTVPRSRCWRPSGRAAPRRDGHQIHPLQGV